MKGFGPPEIAQFYRLLHARGQDTATLAEKVGRSHTTVSRVLCGARRRGPIWKKLSALLVPEELRLLDVAQASTWNKKRVEKRPVWTPGKITK